MNKDVIYIDVEDDITAIISKVKSSKEKIVALVPPKRIGVLQSAVNLRLLARAATQSHKHLVIITNNPALSALAAAAALPVAKNLQTKPGLAEIPALDVDDGEDIIDGAQLPVGDHAKTAVAAAAVRTSIPVKDNTGTDAAVDQIAKAAAPSAGGTTLAPKAKKGTKVPNFNIFRKKMVLIIGGSLLGILFLIWAVFIAPQATIIISASTTDSSVNEKVTFDPAATTDITTATIRSVTQQVKKDDSIEFDATGKKDVGEKAKGTVKFSTGSISNLGTTIPAGTQLTSSGGKVFLTDAAVTFTISNYNDAPTTVTAAASGASYNGANGSVSGAPSGVNATFTAATTGGTDKQITVVTADDVQKATDALVERDKAAMQEQLKTQFGSNVIVLDSTLVVTQTGAVSTPAIDQEVPAGTKAKVSASLTATMTGVEKTEASKYLDEYFAKQLEGKPEQKVYSNGIDNVTFTNVNAPKDAKITANIVATAQIGPKIDDEAIKKAAAGKRYGEIQSAIEAVPGVNSVDVKFWPFWVTSAPTNTNKINVEFKLDESK